MRRTKPMSSVWPETTLPAPVTDWDWGGRIAGLARQTGASYIVGAYDPAEDPLIRESYNAAHVYDKTGRKLGVYHKVRLVPFGEFVPLRDHLPLLKNYGVRDVDVLPGKTHNLVTTRIGKVGIGICFESLFPQIARLRDEAGSGNTVHPDKRCLVRAHAGSV